MFLNGKVFFSVHHTDQSCSEHSSQIKTDQTHVDTHFSIHHSHPPIIKRKSVTLYPQPLGVPISLRLLFCFFLGWKNSRGPAWKRLTGEESWLLEINPDIPNTELCENIPSNNPEQTSPIRVKECFYPHLRVYLPLTLPTFVRWIKQLLSEVQATHIFKSHPILCSSERDWSEIDIKNGKK